MSFCFRYFAYRIFPQRFVTKYVYEDNTAITNPSLCYRLGGVTHYVPLILPSDECYDKEHFFRYSYAALFGDTIHVIYKGKEYVVPNNRTAIFSIPAGTYVGESAFRLFNQFIPLNSFRILKRRATIEHVGATRIFPAGTAVWLTYAYGGETVNLTFTQNKNSMPQRDPQSSSEKEWWLPSDNSNPTIVLHNLPSSEWSELYFSLKNGVLFI